MDAFLSSRLTATLLLSIFLPDKLEAIMLFLLSSEGERMRRLLASSVSSTGCELTSSTRWRTVLPLSSRPRQAMVLKYRSFLSLLVMLSSPCHAEDRYSEDAFSQASLFEIFIPFTSNIQFLCLKLVVFFFVNFFCGVDGSPKYTAFYCY